MGAKPAATKDTSSSQRPGDGDSPPPFCSTATKSQKTRHHHLSQSMQDKREPLKKRRPRAPRPKGSRKTLSPQGHIL